MGRVVVNKDILNKVEVTICFDSANYKALMELNNNVAIYLVDYAEAKGVADCLKFNAFETYTIHDGIPLSARFKLVFYRAKEEGSREGLTSMGNGTQWQADIANLVFGFAEEINNEGYLKDYLGEDTYVYSVILRNGEKQIEWLGWKQPGAHIPPKNKTN